MHAGRQAQAGTDDRSRPPTATDGGRAGAPVLYGCGGAQRMVTPKAQSVAIIAHVEGAAGGGAREERACGGAGGGAQGAGARAARVGTCSRCRSWQRANGLERRAAGVSLCAWASCCWASWASARACAPLAVARQGNSEERDERDSWWAVGEAYKPLFFYLSRLFFHTRKFHFRDTNS